MSVCSPHIFHAHLHWSKPHFKCLRTITWLMAGVLNSGAQEYVELLVTTSLQSYAPTSLPTSSFSPMHLDSSRPNLHRTSEARPIPPTRPNDPLSSNKTECTLWAMSHGRYLNETKLKIERNTQGVQLFYIRNV